MTWETVFLHVSAGFFGTPFFFGVCGSCNVNVIFDHFCWSVGKRTQIWKTALASGGDEPPGHPAARGMIVRRVLFTQSAWGSFFLQI